MKQTFVLSHSIARQRAIAACQSAPDGYIVSLSPASKSRAQEALYHCLFSDVARQLDFMGEKRDAETWKRLLVDAFVRVKSAEGDPVQGTGSIIPNLDGSGFVQLGVQTRRFSKKHASEFIEYLYSFGADRNVQWSEPVAQGYEEIRGAA